MAGPLTPSQTPRFYTGDQFAAIQERLADVRTNGDGYGDTVFWARSWLARVAEVALPVEAIRAHLAHEEVQRCRQVLADVARGVADQDRTRTDALLLELLEPAPLGPVTGVTPTSVWLDAGFVQQFTGSLARQRAAVPPTRAPVLLTAFHQLSSAMLSGRDGRPVQTEATTSARTWALARVEAVVAHPDLGGQTRDALANAVTAMRDASGRPAPRVHAATPLSAGHSVDHSAGVSTRAMEV